MHFFYVLLKVGQKHENLSGTSFRNNSDGKNENTCMFHTFSLQLSQLYYGIFLVICKIQLTIHMHLK